MLGDQTEGVRRLSDICVSEKSQASSLWWKNDLKI